MNVQFWFEHNLPFIVFAAVGASLVVGVWFLILENRSPSIGRGGLDVPDRIPPRPAASGAGAGASRPEAETEDEAAERARRERVTEIRQLLGAISDLRVARGLPAVDIEAEVQRLARCAELDPSQLDLGSLFPLATQARVPVPPAPSPLRRTRARAGQGRPGERAA